MAPPPPPVPPGPPVLLEGIPVHPFTVESLHEYMGAVLAARRRARILNVNVHAMNLAHRLPAFRVLLQEAEAVFCDGEGVRLAARLTGQRLPARITYADWLWQLAAWCAAGGRTLYFLGARPGVAAEAAERLVAAHPGLRIVGVRHGYWGREGVSDEEVVAAIDACRPDVLVLGLGMPWQELWLGSWWERLTTSIVLTGGACFDYASGRLARCPSWMRRRGLEWLYRLLQEPRRLVARYALGNPWFLGRILIGRLRPSQRGARR